MCVPLSEKKRLTPKLARRQRRNATFKKPDPTTGYVPQETHYAATEFGCQMKNGGSAQKARKTEVFGKKCEKSHIPRVSGRTVTRQLLEAIDCLANDEVLTRGRSSVKPLPHVAISVLPAQLLLKICHNEC